MLRGFPRATVAFSLATKAAVQLQQLDMALERLEWTDGSIPSGQLEVCFWEFIQSYIYIYIYELFNLVFALFVNKPQTCYVCIHTYYVFVLLVFFFLAFCFCCFSPWMKGLLHVWWLFFPLMEGLLPCLVG